MAFVTDPREQPDFDLDEDLFDFAGVGPEPDEPDEDLEEIFASFRDPELERELDELSGVARAQAGESQVEPEHELEPQLETASREPAPVAAPRTRIAPLSVPASAPAPTPAVPAAEREPVQPLHAPAASPARLSRSVVAIAAAVTMLNSVLAIAVIGRRDAVNPVQADTVRADSEASEIDPLPEPEPETGLPDPDGLDVIHSHPVLDEARAQISRGEYASARQRVYGLLAIIDRLEDPQRAALEADCQFLIAQSLHLEALSRMGSPR